jgi:hypothetical protein
LRTGEVGQLSEDVFPADEVATPVLDELIECPAFLFLPGSGGGFLPSLVSRSRISKLLGNPLSPFI